MHDMGSSHTIIHAHAAGTWPGILDLFIGFSDLEMEASERSKHKTGGKLAESDLGSGLRNLLKASENEQRSGKRHQLHRRIGKLVSYISTTLTSQYEQGILKTRLGSDYLAVLKQFALVPEYLPLIEPVAIAGG
jgi:hypothetical protein